MQRDPVTGWSDEFRAWLHAYRSGVNGDQLARLDHAAIEAAERFRRANREGICPTCGHAVRPWPDHPG